MFCWKFRNFTLTKVPEALVLAKDFLSRLPLNCPALASELSGMGMAWLESPNAKAGVKGLAGDLHAVSAIRTSKSKSSHKPYEMTADTCAHFEK